jgi:hypothetical protein
MWQSIIIPIVRGLIFDVSNPYRYSEARLEELILVSSILVFQDVDFQTSYTVNLSCNTITPDPSDDHDFVAIVALRTACMISQGEHRNAARQALSVKDGPSAIDTRDSATHYGGLAKNACDAYEKSKLSYQIGDGSVGRAIVSPYSTGQYETARR